MRQLRRLKRLWRRSLTHSHKRTLMGPSRRCWNGTTSALQLEELTSSFMCVQSMKVPIWKKSGNLFNDPRASDLYRIQILNKNKKLMSYLSSWNTHKYSVSEKFRSNFYFNNLSTSRSNDLWPHALKQLQILFNVFFWSEIQISFSAKEKDV